MNDLIQQLLRAAEEIGRGVYSPGHAALMRKAAEAIKAVEKELSPKNAATQTTGPCGLCRYFPPSSMDGKPCAVCPAAPRQ